MVRSLASKAPVQILDEPTSALDNNSESHIFDYLIAKSRSVVVVAHRLHTVRNFDKIILMEEGKIASIGTHDELLRENVTYGYLCGSDS